jgi:hypothetical protein
MTTVEIFQCQESIQDIIIYRHIKFWWYRTMLNFCGIVVAILKMATSRNCYIQHWPISSQFDMWLDNDVLNWFPTLKNFYRSPFSKCITKIQHCPISSQFDMWVNNDVPVAVIFKKATSRNCSMSGLKSGQHKLTTYWKAVKSDNVEFVQYCGGHFENGDR